LIELLSEEEDSAPDAAEQLRTFHKDNLIEFRRRRPPSLESVQEGGASGASFAGKH
jgi:hypothetical protein